MPTAFTEPGSDPSASATPMSRVDATLPTRTVAWLAKDVRARRLVNSVWDKLGELEQAGHYPGAIDALEVS